LAVASTHTDEQQSLRAASLARVEQAHLPCLPGEVARLKETGYVVRQGLALIDTQDRQVSGTLQNSTRSNDKIH
jgi:hypothetical protein